MSTYGYGNLPADQRQTALKKEEAPLTAMQRWLLPAVLLLGVIFQFFVFEGLSIYPYFWVGYMIVFHTFCLEKVKKRLMAAPFAAVALFLCIVFVLQGWGYSDSNLMGINFLAIPALLMLHAQAVMQPFPAQQESRYFELFFYGFFAQPFIHIGRFFKAVGSLFQGKEKNRMVWIGLLIAAPVVCVVLGLLLSADAVMGLFARNLFVDIRIGEYIIRLFLIVIIAILFYSFLYGAVFHAPRPLNERTYKKFLPTAPRIVVCSLLVVYALFTCVQFVYLFGGRGLPENLTYAEYAREGFNQLIMVAVINLCVFAFCLSRTLEDKSMRVILLALLGFTGVILASAFTRLGLYIQAYDLTFKRIQAMWMLIYISIAIVLCGVRLYKPKLPLLRICAYAFIAWYALLNVPDLNKLYMIRF